MDRKNNSNVGKCACDESESAQESDGSNPESPKDKRTKIFPSLGLNLRRGRSLHFTSKRAKKLSPPTTPDNGFLNGSSASTSSTSGSCNGVAAGTVTLNTALKKFIKFNCVKREPKGFMDGPSDIVTADQSCCRCTCYKERNELPNPNVCKPKEQFPIVVREEVPIESLDRREDPLVPREEATEDNSQSEIQNRNEPERVSDGNLGIYGTGCLTLPSMFLNTQFIDIQSIGSIHEDCDEQARMQRAREIEQGVEPPANYRSMTRVQLVCSDVDMKGNGQGPRRLQLVCPPDVTVDSIQALFQTHVTVQSCPMDTIAGCHTQVDYIHCLVPDLLDITNCSFYWGKMDRYEAERLLDGKPEGTFLLRDSAQEEFLFSVSFRKYNRSLHARIEQWNHKFSFDSHDPNVYTSNTVCGLIEHYKDTSSCMFFEPMLTRPLHRNFTFSLQHLCRATVVNRLTYDSVNQLQLPKILKCYLKEYHYRQKVRVERFDDDVHWIDLRNELS